MNALKTLFLAGFLLVIAAVAFPSPRRDARVQFFGDLYVPKHVMDQAMPPAPPFDPFMRVRELLSLGDHNIVNLEGVLTDSAFTFPEEKLYHLKMPATLAELMRDVGIHVVTLANNHAMDFGQTGLMDTLQRLTRHGIKSVGAGRNEAEATRPLIIPTPAGSVCLLTYSRTLPESFWAKGERAGTSSLSYEGISAAVKDCRDKHPFVFVTFHWGEELLSTPKSYQRELAQVSIRAGADAVIGHHPHILQSIEFFEGKPVLYSIGNFVFGTIPIVGRQEGMAVTFPLEKGQPLRTMELHPFVVDNRAVHYQPRGLNAGEKDPILAHLPAKHSCRWLGKQRHWTCEFNPPPLIGRR